ncbi:probable basic-leucine zipper transcription factor Q [Prorops nasuta]|uniref:probable basic-leucine zipper transcription factor Q n=1 Tax=Prorops nasuta TaxID=863751 RepID=UPI0034D01AE5
MRLVLVVAIVSCTALTANLALAAAEEEEGDEALTASQLVVPTAPVKLDKGLRRALLRALADLEAESAEQHREEEQEEGEEASEIKMHLDDVAKKDLNKDLGVAQKATLSFDSFPADEDLPSEDKLQNSSFVEIEKFSTTSASSLPSMIIEKATKNDAQSFHAIMPTSSNYETTTQVIENLIGSNSNGIAAANALIAPKPTVSSPTALPRPTSNKTSSEAKEKTEDVKIFQAPLVAAFTVQQDERGIPKSVVPIYRPSGDGQALTLQEQLEFKQKLLEKQLAELQHQQIQQTEFLLRQQQLYEQQLRQKQQQQLYLQEQARLKQLEEQNRLKFFEQQRLKRLEEQRLYRLQQQQQQQKPQFFDQTNNIRSLQPPLQSPNVQFHPSVTLEVPNAAPAQPFLFNYQQQQQQQSQQLQQPQQLQQQQPQRLQQQPQQLQQQQLQPQQLQPQQQQPQQLQQLQQQRLQQSFGAFPNDFQGSVQQANRFNRQEAFNSVGNFGLNFDNKASGSRNSFGFNGLPVRPPLQAPPQSQNNFIFNPYNQLRQRPQQTPAKQIQHLLYQSGIAGDLGSLQGSGSQEDLNIVSKVLALHVGALPTNNLQNSLLARAPGSA